MKNACVLVGLALLALVAIGACATTEGDGELPPLGLSFYEATSACPTDESYKNHALPNEILFLTFSLSNSTGTKLMEREVAVQSSCGSDPNCLVPGSKGFLLRGVPAGRNMQLHIEAIGAKNVVAWVGDAYKITVTPQSNIEQSPVVSVFMRRVDSLTTGLCMPNVPRALHTATLLRDGRYVLITGGVSKLLTTEQGGSTCEPKNEPNVTTPPGCLALVGANTVMRYDMQTGEYVQLSVPLDQKRAGHQAVLLADGRVLIMGGTQQVWMLTTQNGRGYFEPGEDPIDTAIIYNPDYKDAKGNLTGHIDPVDGTGRLTIQMASGRAFFAITQFDTDGTKQLLSGGFGKDGRLSSMEMMSYAPSKGDTTPRFDLLKNAMRAERSGHTASLSGKQVLFYGGATPGQPVAEFYVGENDPTELPTGFGDTASWPNLYYHAAVVLEAGKKIVLSGGFIKTQEDGTKPEKFSDAGKDVITFDMVGKTYSRGAMTRPRVFHQMAELPGGQGLIVGGLAGANLAAGAGELEIYNPQTQKVSDLKKGTVNVTLVEPRMGFSLTTMPDTSLVIIGGMAPDAVIANPNNKTLLYSTEIFYQKH